MGKVRYACSSVLCALFIFARRTCGADYEAERLRCARGSDFPAVRRAFDLNATFLPIMSGQKFAELAPKVLSTDPWIVYFEKFLSEAEVRKIEKHLFDPSREAEFQASSAGNSGLHSARYSETAYCIGACDEHKIIQTVRGRASSITGVPEENFDFSQALRYKKKMFYKEHHDNHVTFHFGPSGARIFTYFVYLSDKGLRGGETFFPKLQIKAPAKRGAAVLFVNTKDENPMVTDARTLHESLPVVAGEKRGMNMWLYQYNFRHFWAQGCTTIELADALGSLGKAAVRTSPKVFFQNHAKKATVHIFLKRYYNRGYNEQLDEQTAAYINAVGPGGSLEVESSEGEVFLIRKENKPDSKLLKEYSVRATKNQRVHIGKRPKENQKPAEEL